MKNINSYTKETQQMSSTINKKKTMTQGKEDTQNQ